MYRLPNLNEQSINFAVVRSPDEQRSQVLDASQHLTIAAAIEIGGAA